MPGQVGDLPHDTGKLLMWRRPPACDPAGRTEAGILSHLLRHYTPTALLWRQERILHPQSFITLAV